MVKWIIVWCDVFTAYKQGPWGWIWGSRRRGFGLNESCQVAQEGAAGGQLVSRGRYSPCKEIVCTSSGLAVYTQLGSPFLREPPPPPPFLVRKVYGSTQKHSLVISTLLYLLPDVSQTFPPPCVGFSKGTGLRLHKGASWRGGVAERTRHRRVGYQKRA